MSYAAAGDRRLALTNAHNGQTQERPDGGRSVPNFVQPRTILFVSTVPQSLWHFARPHWRTLRRHGYSIVAVSSPGEFLSRCLTDGAAGAHAIAMHRAITPLSDVAAVIRMWMLLRRVRPAIVHTHTPKAGLIGMLAAALAGVGIRVYTFNGAVWLTGGRWRRYLLMAMDRLACRLATSVLCVSPSLRQTVVKAGICDGNKAVVLGSGGSHGVDTQFFDPDQITAEDQRSFRQRLGIPAGARVLGFVGRIVPDKGIRELYEAWRQLRREFDDLHLLLCGPAMSSRPVPKEITDAIDRDPRVKQLAVPHAEMPLVYSLMDVCALPSHREGLPNVALEAASMRVPIVTTTAVGCRDAVTDGITGLLIPPGEASALSRAISELVRSNELRRRLGIAARERVIREFSEPIVSASLLDHYLALERGANAAPHRLRPENRASAPG